MRRLCDDWHVKCVDLPLKSENLKLGFWMVVYIQYLQILILEIYL